MSKQEKRIEQDNTANDFLKFIKAKDEQQVRALLAERNHCYLSQSNFFTRIGQCTCPILLQCLNMIQLFCKLASKLLLGKQTEL